MLDKEATQKKLQTALKLAGFTVRREFCSLIIDKFLEERINLEQKDVFNSCIDKLCNSLESQSVTEQSIEKEHIERALEVCLHSGYDKNETVFNVINAFDFPKLRYDPDRKQFFKENKKSKFLSCPDSKTQLFLDRYSTVLQRTRRNFLHKASANTMDIKLQTVDYLLTLTHVSLDTVLILGSLLQVSEGKYYIEDPTGIVELDLSHATYYGGFFVENCFVLVNGLYADKILKVSTIVLPPGEEAKDSRPCFGPLNYFGGPSPSPLKNSIKLREHLENHPNNMMMFFSDVWLDNPQIFEKFEVLFDGMKDSPPVAFVFMGNFMSQMYGSESIELMRKLFKQLGELIMKYETLVENSHFIFVPGMEDPCTPHIAPRMTLPKFVTSEMTKVFNKAIFATNPCRIQYCTREITVFRADILTKLMQGALHKPEKDKISDYLTRTVISQGHLCPLSLNALPVHWDFDYTLRLYPVPDLVVIGDKIESYKNEYKGCQVINPGSFCESGFQFQSYVPYDNSVDACIL